MDNKSFKDLELRIVSPSFDSNLTDVILELEKLRSPRRTNSRVPIVVFRQLKEVFHNLESLGSVRIEGNNTTLSEIVEKTIDGSITSSSDENIKEFRNTQEALNFIESNVQESTNIDKALISELHKITVKDLIPEKEGDYTPGQYRTTEVSIKGSSHVPPISVKINDYMEELINFINSQHDPKHKLLSVAVAHHRFAWIHPFRNGNGRTVRLLTYAMLTSLGFAVKRIINPTAIFCMNRDNYYDMLAEADMGSDEGILKWSEYVLSSLLSEVKKIDKLLDYDFLIPKILVPALKDSLDRKFITPIQYKVLVDAARKGLIKARDVQKIVQTKYPSETSRFIKKLRDESLIQSVSGLWGIRHTYSIAFVNSYLLRSIVKILKEHDFIGKLDENRL